MQMLPDRGTGVDDLVEIHMDFGNPWSLFSSVIIGLIGMAYFIYGKKQTDLRCLGAGVLMCVFPYFVTSVIAMWLITAACIGGVWVSGKYLA